MKKVLIVLAVAFIILQVFRIDKTNPPLNEGMDFLRIKNPPENIAKIIKTSCYDCHSNETKYPWYSNIQPVAWMLQNHIQDGRKHLNFSTFATYDPKKQAHKMEEAAEMIEKGEMPMESYLIMHSDAKLDPQQKAELIKYFKDLQQETLRANTF